MLKVDISIAKRAGSITMDRRGVSTIRGRSNGMTNTGTYWSSPKQLRRRTYLTATSFSLFPKRYVLLYIATITK